MIWGSSGGSGIVAFVGISSVVYSIHLLFQNRALRKALISREQENGADETTKDDDSGKKESFVMREIGVIRSPFPHRAGCPRQGLLVPNARSQLVLHSSAVSFECVDGLAAYSHVWILFQFHMNSIPKGKQQQQRAVNAPFQGSKVRPPRAGGKKVGVLATRSPHRPNNVGLSLAMLENTHIESVLLPSGKVQKVMVIQLLGLDLVDGTPVYDIKPYLPWDSVGKIEKINIDPNPSLSDTISDQMENAAHVNSAHIGKENSIRVPPWVVADDELPFVLWRSKAREAVVNEWMMGTLLPLYPPPPSSLKNTNGEVCRAISQVIAQDPRAAHDGRGQQSHGDVLFEITFCQLRIGFFVDSAGMAQVVHAQRDMGDVTACPGSYQHSLALRRQAEAQSTTQLQWANPIREGVVDGLWDLANGSIWQPPQNIDIPSSGCDMKIGDFPSCNELSNDR